MNQSESNQSQPGSYEPQPVGEQGPPPQAARQPRRQPNRPIVVYSLMGVSIFVYFAQIISQYALGIDLPAAIGVKANELILQGQVWRLFTPMLLHGSILHIGFNMYALYVMGPALERYYGHFRFLALYVIAGFAGNVLSFLFSAAPSLGASTAIFGVLGAQGVFLYLNRQVFGPAARSALGNVALIAAVNLLIGGASPMIDNWGHVGGLVGGTLFAWFGGPLYKIEGLYPPYVVSDARGTGEALRAGLGVSALFLLLAAIAFILRLG